MRTSTLKRLDKKVLELGERLYLEEGKNIPALDCANAWRNLNSFFLSANQLKDYRLGNRHIVPRITLVIQRWGNLIPLDQLGYNPRLRMRRLERNYLHVDSFNRCRSFLLSRNPSKVSTHGIHFGSGRKATPACMVGGTFCWFPGRLHVNFYLRASEVTKTFGADLHFLDRVIFGSSVTGEELKGAVPKWMSNRLGPVIIHLDMAYQLAQWYPLVDITMPGYPLNTFDHKYHRMCMDSLTLARDLSYESKWKPERRLHKYYRKAIGKFRTDKQGRVLSGPSFFPFPKKHL